MSVVPDNPKKRIYFAKNDVRPDGAGYISFETGQYIWIGSDDQCFGYIDDMRSLRKLKGYVEAAIAHRERKKLPRRKARKT